MKNYLIIFANGPKTLFGQVNHQYLIAYAASEAAAKDIGQTTTIHMQGYWEVWDVETLD